MKTILAPIDFSPATDGVIDAAATLARSIGGRVVLLHAVQPIILTSDYGLAMENFSEAIAVSEKHAIKRLAEFRDKLVATVPEVATRQANGPAIAAILAEAASCSANYIVVGSHGHTALYDLLVGSTTHGILRKATCPVIIVPPKR